MLLTLLSVLLLVVFIVLYFFSQFGLLFPYFLAWLVRFDWIMDIVILSW